MKNIGWIIAGAAVVLAVALYFIRLAIDKRKLEEKGDDGIKASANHFQRAFTCFDRSWAPPVEGTIIMLSPAGKTELSPPEQRSAAAKDDETKTWPTLPDPNVRPPDLVVVQEGYSPTRKLAEKAKAKKERDLDEAALADWRELMESRRLKNRIRRFFHGG